MYFCFDINQFSKDKIKVGTVKEQNTQTGSGIEQDRGPDSRRVTSLSWVEISKEKSKQQDTWLKVSNKQSLHQDIR